MTTGNLFQSLFDAPASSRGFLRFHDGYVEFVGQETGRITILGGRTVPGLGTVLTLHEEGHSYWSGRGQRGYSGARVQVVLIQRSDDGLTRYVDMGSHELLRTAADRAVKTNVIKERLT